MFGCHELDKKEKKIEKIEIRNEKKMKQQTSQNVAIALALYIRMLVDSKILCCGDGSLIVVHVNVYCIQLVSLGVVSRNNFSEWTLH